MFIQPAASLVVMVNGLISETEDNPARDPSLHRGAWPYGSCEGVWYASNRDDRKTCSSLQRVWWYGLTSDVQDALSGFWLMPL